jgi:hypothetical protein
MACLTQTLTGGHDRRKIKWNAATLQQFTGDQSHRKKISF